MVRMKLMSYPDKYFDRSRSRISSGIQRLHILPKPHRLLFFFFKKKGRDITIVIILSTKFYVTSPHSTKLETKVITYQNRQDYDDPDIVNSLIEGKESKN